MRLQPRCPAGPSLKSLLLRTLALGLGAGLASVLTANFSERTSGAMLWLSYFSHLACLLLLLSSVLEIISCVVPVRSAARLLRTNALLVLASLALCFIIGEFTLPLVERVFNTSKMSSEPPPELAMRNVSIPGASSAYYWNGILHLHDETGFRHIGPWPEKDPQVLRIIVLGDSLTYGQGVAEEDTYVRVLEKELRQEARVELINLGVQGFQSVNILGTLKRMEPLLRPDLVLYGVCLNDFLPHRTGQYAARGFAFPLPNKTKEMFLSRSRLGPALDQGYQKLMLTLHLQKDFHDDILEDFSNYQQAFAAHVRKMNAYVTGKGLPPPLAMVLDQFPEIGSRGYRIAKIAEKLLEAGKVEVIPLEPFYQRYNGRRFAVSPWEGHPNAEAHKIFAAMFAEKIRGLPIFAKYKKGN